MEEPTADHHKIAEEYLERCDELLDDCQLILDSLEGIFETTPMPSELLGW
ncbi:MAG TPA: hypothetical protein VMW86_09885 [Dehalococcoidales bacterium]|nr:hypothetical protein [Dehalococcoidales bacterium]